MFYIVSCGILEKGFLILNKAKYLYNLCDNTAKINKILYTGKLGKLAITGYLCQSSRW